MRFGAHVSIAGSVAEAPGRGLELGCRTLQIFTKNARQWKARPIGPEDAERFRAAFAEGPLWSVVAHNTYLINMADPRQPGWEKSVAAMIDEVDRCEALGVPYLVAHPGAHRDSGEEAGLRRIAPVHLVDHGRHRLLPAGLVRVGGRAQRDGPLI